MHTENDILMTGLAFQQPAPAQLALNPAPEPPIKRRGRPRKSEPRPEGSGASRRAAHTSARDTVTCEHCQKPFAPHHLAKAPWYCSKARCKKARLARRNGAADGSAGRPLSGLAAQLVGLAPEDALIAYARDHGNRIMVTEALPELKAAGVFTGNAKAIFNKATASTSRSGAAGRSARSPISGSRTRDRSSAASRSSRSSRMTASFQSCARSRTVRACGSSSSASGSRSVCRRATGSKKKFFTNRFAAGAISISTSTARHPTRCATWRR